MKEEVGWGVNQLIWQKPTASTNQLRLAPGFILFRVPGRVESIATSVSVGFAQQAFVSMEQVLSVRQVQVDADYPAESSSWLIGLIGLIE